MAVNEVPPLPGPSMEERPGGLLRGVSTPTRHHQGGPPVLLPGRAAVRRRPLWVRVLDFVGVVDWIEAWELRRDRAALDAARRNPHRREQSVPADKAWAELRAERAQRKRRP